MNIWIRINFIIVNLSLAILSCLMLAGNSYALDVMDLQTSGDSTASFNFEALQGKVARIGSGNVTGIANSRIGLVIHKSDATILGIWSPAGWNIINNQIGNGKPEPIWTMQLMPEGSMNPIAVDSSEVENISYEFEAHNPRNQITLRMNFAPIKVGREEISVSAFVSLSPDDEALRWRLNAKVHGNTMSVWEVRYPRIQVVAPDKDPLKNYVVSPYRRGRLDIFGENAPISDAATPYPGAGAKFQFMAAYGDDTQRGFYIAAEDSQGYSKKLTKQNNPKHNSVILSFDHLPANRGIMGTGFTQPYDVVTRPFSGDWYDSARIYRKWWINQVWASKGLLRTREDIPDWLKKTQVITRPATIDTQKPSAIEKGEMALQKELDGQPLAGIWYGVQNNITGIPGLNTGGDGHIRGIRTDVSESVQRLKLQNIHHLAYIQSLIYNPLKSDPIDATDAAKYVARDRDGKPYGVEKKDWQYMDRSTEWWQERQITMTKNAIIAGFDGIYMDSFGKNSDECFVPEHGHAIGGGNTGIAGQRQLAQRVLAAIKKINPDAVLSGEDPVEAFRDLVQLNLFSMNVWPRYIPLYRTIWGDYSLGYGRTIDASGDSPDNVIPEMASLFVNGRIIGRIFVSGERTILDDPEYADAKVLLQKMAKFGDKQIEYLRFGEYLHPLQWEQELPQVTYRERVLNYKITEPAIASSVTRSYEDGSVGIALVNIGKNPLKLHVPIDPSQRADKSAKNKMSTLWRVNERGDRIKMAQGEAAWKQSISLDPHEIAFLIIQ